MQELDRLPLQLRTLSIQERKKKLDSQLDSVEKNIGRLEKPGKVWIKKNGSLDPLLHIEPLSASCRTTARKTVPNESVGRESGGGLWAREG